MKTSAMQLQNRLKESKSSISYTLIFSVLLLIFVAVVYTGKVTIGLTPNLDSDLMHPLELAQMQFQAAVMLEPENEDSYKYLADIYQQSANIELIEDLWLRSIEANPNSLWAYENLLQHYQASGNADSEELVWNQAIENNSDAQWPYNNLSNYYMDNANFRSAEQVWNGAIIANPEQSWPYLRLATLYRSKNRTQDALNTYIRASKEHNDKVDVHIALGRFYQSSQQWEQALDSYARALQLEKERGLYYLYYGQSLLEVGKPQEAINSFYQGLILEPIAGNYSYISSALDGYDEELSIELYEQLLTNNPSDAVALNQLVKLLVEIEQCEKAIQFAEHNVALVRSAESYMVFGYAQEQCGQTAAATQTYFTSIERLPFSTDLYFSLASNLLLQERDVEAAQILIRALELKGNAASYENARTILNTYLPPDKSQETLFQILSVTLPDVPSLYGRLVWQYQVKNEFGKTTELLRRAVEKYPERIWPHMKLGDILMQSEDYADAVLAYQRVLQINPLDETAKLALGEALLRSGEIQSAEQIFRNILSGEIPTQAKYNRIRSIIHRSLEWPVERKIQEEIALLHFQDSKKVYAELAEWYIQVDSIDAAIDAYQSLLQMYTPELSSRLRLAELYVLQNDCTNALLTVNTIKNLHTMAVGELHEVGNIYNHCNEWTLALNTYEIALQNRLAELNSSLRSSFVDTLENEFSTVLNSNQFHNALEKASLKVSLTNAELYNQLGLYFEEKGNWDLAGELFEKGVTLEPMGRNANFNRGRLLQLIGDYQSSIPYLQRATFAEPNDQVTRLYWGRSLLAVEEFEQGATILRSAFSLDSTDWAVDYLAQSYIYYLDTGDTLSLVLDVLAEIYLKESYPYENAIRAFSERGQSDFAFAVANQALEIYPDEVWPYLEIARLLRSVGRVELAESVLREQVEKHPANAVIRLELGFTLQSLERFEDALLEMQIAATLSPNEGWLRIYLGQALMDRERLTEGFVALQNGLKAESTEIAYEYVDDLLTQYTSPEQALRFYANILAASPTNELAQLYLTMWTRVIQDR